MGLMTQLAFYPTLGYNLARNKWNGKWWAWYTRLDETVVLGALPFKSMMTELIEKERVGGVVCLNEPHEMQHGWVAQQADWEAAGVKYHWIPTPDFTAAPSPTQIRSAVDFIRTFEGTDRSVYVHCKAGRSRSALVAVCYLIDRHKWYTNTAIDSVYHKRYQIALRDQHMLALNDFATKTLKGNSKTAQAS